MDLANYIYQILASQITIMWSWGFHNPVAIENGLQFDVQGYLHRGKVRVQLNGADLFDITLINRNGTIRETISDVYADGLVQAIDMNVENDGSGTYKDTVQAEYCIIA